MELINMTTPTTAEDLPTIEDSLTYIRGNYESMYPKADGRRKTIGNIPTRLHGEIMAMAEARNLRMFEIISGMWDFYAEYEATFETELSEQRNTPKSRR
jgi:hypothetical protein